MHRKDRHSTLERICGAAMLLQQVLSVTAASTLPSARSGTDCFGAVCHPVEEFCSAFSETCMQCSAICEAGTQNYQPDMCAKECSDYNKFEPLKMEIHTIQMQQNIILVLLVVLLVLVGIRCACKCVRWLRHKRCVMYALQKLQPRKDPHAAAASAAATAAAHNGKDLGGTTISNICAINEMERAPSQIYSVTGAEGSVMTMTTPVSTRYPAENTITPTTQTHEYSYDNQALAVTPVSEKPGGKAVF